MFLIIFFYRSPKRRLSDILSPSELLDSPLDFDELDEALHESSLYRDIENDLNNHFENTF